MKRSEMIKYLAKIIRSSGTVSSDNPLNEYELAEDVLSAIEEQGMLPPTLTGYVEVEEHENEIIVKLWSWESEHQKLTPSPLTEEEIKELIENDEDLQNEKK